MLCNSAELIKNAQTALHGFVNRTFPTTISFPTPKGALKEQLLQMTHQFSLLTTSLSVDSRVLALLMSGVEEMNVKSLSQGPKTW